MSDLLARLANMFGPPDTDDPRVWFAEVNKLIASHDPDVKARAFDLIMRSHKGHRFPAISEIISACRDASDELHPAKEPQKFPEWSKSAFAVADKLIASDLGMRAADEGWIQPLHAFCRNHRRLPRLGEISDCQMAAREFERSYAMVSDGNGGLLQAALQRLGDEMLKRREKLAGMAHGEIFE